MSNQAGTFLINKSARNFKTAEQLGTYSGVNLWLTDDAESQLTQEDINSVVAGGTFTKQKDEHGNDIILGYKSNPWNTTGRVLNIVNPFGTVQMASDILRSMVYETGLAMNYAPFEADAMVPPHFEIGDAVNINGEHHGIYSYQSKQSRLPLSSVKASADEEVDHEYPFKSDVKSRNITRKFQSVQSQFIVQAGEINARVTKESADDPEHTESFAWSLTHNGFYINNGEIKADGTNLFNFNSDGLHIRGDIEADTGHIGGEDGFTIQSGKLYSGKSSMSSASEGVYIGPDGIALGNGFSVTNGGYLTATSGSFGSLTVNNSGNTVGGYYGDLGGCGGSVSNLGGSISTGMSLAGTSLTIGNLKTYSEQGAQALKDLGNYMAGSVIANAFKATTVYAVSNLYLGSKTLHTNGIHNVALGGTYTGSCLVNGVRGSCSITITGYDIAAVNYT